MPGEIPATAAPPATTAEAAIGPPASSSLQLILPQSQQLQPQNTPLRPSKHTATATQHPPTPAHRVRTRTPRPRPLSRNRPLSRAVHLRHHYAYTCTFCWETYRASSLSAPRVVGTNARIACEGCWVQLHNLSICWACGDSVVRGEECVSFGWTFWHRGCFGCLSCRAPLTAPGDVGEFAVEVFETPVCGRCHAEDGEETGDDSAGNAASGSDGCEDLRLGKTMRRMKALEAGGQPKGGRKSVARRSKRQRHGVVKDVAEGLKIQEGVHVCQDIQSDMAVNPPHTDGSKDGTSNPPNPPTKDRPHKSVSTTIRHPALEFRVQSPQRRHPSLRRDTPVPYISIFDPLNTPAFKPVSKSKKPPRWMSRKPSSIAGALQLAPRSQPVRPEDVSVLASHEVVVVVQQQLPEAIVKEAEQPPPTSSLIPKSSLQFQKSRRRSGGGGASSPHPLVVSFAASPPNPKTHQRVSPAARQKLKSRKATPIPPTFTRKELSSYPFFQNPRRPIVPAVESSWGNLSKLSPGLFPYGESAGGATSGSGEPVVVGGGKGRKGGGEIVMNRGVVLGQPRVISSFRSTEYLDKYRDRDGGGGKGESTTSTNPTLTHTCPCCSGTISPSIPPSIPSTIKASNGHHYHLPCFTCRICRKPIDTAKGKLDDYMFLMQIPHHRRCVAGEMIGKKKGARGNNKDASVALLKPRGDTPPDPPPPNPRAHKIAATTASPPKDHNALSSFFSVRKKPPIPPLPPLDPACAACGLPLLPPSDILLGPSETKVHKPCMRCRRCGDRMATTRWYEWDGKGLMVLLCRECWRRGRRERGYTVEEIGREEKGLLGG